MKQVHFVVRSGVGNLLSSPDLYPSMRLRLIYLLLLPLLAACEPSLSPGPRVDFISSTRFVSGNRRITTPGDTFATRIYARAQDTENARLQQLRIEVEYLPVPTPFVYDALYDPEDPPTSTITYLDSTFDRTDFAFQNVQTARTNAGLEVWRYKVTDAKKVTGERSFKVRLPRTDSAAVYHSYAVVLQAPSAIDPARRSFLALREGFAFPKFTVRTNAATQQLVDLLYLPGSTVATPTLVTTEFTSSSFTLSSRWISPKRATVLRRTSLTATQFTGITTTAGITAAFNQGSAPITSTGPLTAGTVLAFSTPEGKYGLIQVLGIPAVSIPSVLLQVVVTK